MEKIRRTSDVFEEQTEMLRELLDPSVPQLHELHPVLGWRYAPGYQGGLHRLNGAALRGAKEYAPQPPAGVLRVAAFGDSFVYGTEVGNEDAWPFLVEQAEPGVEMLNFGVPGYGTDQAYLRYQIEVASFAPHVVVIGFAPTDLTRTINVYRRFFSNAEVPLVKPRYVLEENGGLRLLPCPACGLAEASRLLRHPREVLRLGQSDGWYDPLIYENPLYDWSASVRLGAAALARARRRWGPDRLYRAGVFDETSSAFRIECALVETFAGAVRAAGARPLVVMLPDRNAVQAARLGRPRSYDPLTQWLQKQNVDLWDAADDLRAQTDADVDALFTPGGHYSPAGNRTVASGFLRELRARFGARIGHVPR
jgi:hypothetical protein